MEHGDDGADAPADVGLMIITRRRSDSCLRGVAIGLGARTALDAVRAVAADRPSPADSTFRMGGCLVRLGLPKHVPAVLAGGLPGTEPSEPSYRERARAALVQAGIRA